MTSFGIRLNKFDRMLSVQHRHNEIIQYLGDTPFFVYLEDNTDNSRNLVFGTHLTTSTIGQLSDTSSAKLNFAAEWALSLDAQYSELIESGRTVRVPIPSSIDSSISRVQKESIENYRLLRFKVGDLLHPIFLSEPNLDSLFHYQKQGVQWLTERSGAILADDMGLGKTVQVISAVRMLFHRTEFRSIIVACPKSLIATWEKEFRHWAPELGVVVMMPQARIRDDAWKIIFGRCHVILTNYEQFREIPKILLRSSLDLIVADEAHRIRNRDSKIASGIQRLNPSRFWALTGTPIERDLEDLATLLSFVVPHKFTPKDATLHPSSLRSRSRQHVLRRRKQDVLKDLPDVIDNTEMLELSKSQKETYLQTTREFQKSTKSGDSLALLTKLQALCDIDTQSGQSCKVDRTMDLLSQIRERGEKAVVFSYRLQPLRVLMHRVLDRWGKNSCLILVGEMNNQEREDTVNKFQNYDAPFVLLASSRIASEGLTLVEANHVILFNQWWNPSANNQARDRVVRIGQKRKVRVYRFCCRGTVEESLERILRLKENLFSEAVERIHQNEKYVFKQVLQNKGIHSILSETNL